MTFILHKCVPCDKTFYTLPLIVTMTLKFDILMKNVTLDCYLMMVAAQRALSSDNSY